MKDTMNQPNNPLTKINLRVWCLGAIAGLLCSCAATSVKQTWKTPDFHPAVGKFAVITIDERNDLRIGFENRLVRYLENAGAPAFTTSKLLSLAQIKADKRAAADQFRAGGAGSVVILRLMDQEAFMREIRPGNERYAATVTGADYTSWYGYYSVGYMSMSPTYDTLKQKLYLETSVYDLNTEKRLWSGVTQTVVKERMDRVAEMDPLVQKIVAAMRKDGVIQ